jgi:hypothetical protein
VPLATGVSTPKQPADVEVQSPAYLH